MKKNLLLIGIALLLTSMSNAQFFEDVTGNSQKMNAEQTGWDKYAFSGGILWNSAAAGDLDGDGYPDLIYFGNNTQGASGTWIDLNNGDGTFRRAFTSFEGEVVGDKTIPVLFPGLYNGGVDIADFDNDGDMDIVLQGDANAGGDGFSKDYATAVDFYAKVLRNDGKDANDNLIFTAIPLPYAGVRGSIYFGKVDNDNILEIIQSGVLKMADDQFVKKTIIYKWNLTGSTWEILPLTGDPLAAFGEGYARFGDYNKDGLDDILISGWAVEADLGEGEVNEGVTKLYKNIDGNGNFEEDTDIILAPLADAFADFVDYDKDGDLDIALCGFNFETGVREIKIYKNNDGIYEDVNAEFLATVQGGPMLFVDVNGDDFLDILTWGWNDAHLFFLFLNNGDNLTYSFPEFENFVKKGEQFGTITASWKAGATLLDFDKDGRKDVFYVNFTAELLKNLTGAIETSVPEFLKKEIGTLYYFNNMIFLDEETDGLLEIFSIDGKTLLKKNVFAGKSSVNVSLNPGVYVAKISSKNQPSATKKFIVR